MKKVILIALMVLVAVLVVACAGPAEPADTDSSTTPAGAASGTQGTENSTEPEDSEMSTEPDNTTEAPTEQTYPINGKTFIFLGSSVTYGSASGGYSFADYIRDDYDCTCIKEAVSGTTLVDNGSDSYVQRMLKIDKTIDADHFICQLSTNDASQGKPLGKVSESMELEDFDTRTIIGAMEYIICYAKETWDCPVSFYTGTKYDSVAYGKMVDALYELQEKWGIGIIDLWNDEEMNSISESKYNSYMSDPIHPNRLGYKVWWTPKFVEFLEKYE